MLISSRDWWTSFDYTSCTKLLACLVHALESELRWVSLEMEAISAILVASRHTTPMDPPCVPVH